MQKALSHLKLFRKPILGMDPYVAPLEDRIEKVISFWISMKELFLLIP